MFKTEITYTNFLGTEVTETLRFNLSETELLDLIKNDSTFDTGFLTFVSQENNYPRMMEVIRRLVVVSYGEISEDGKYFRKNDDIAIDFLQSAAYDAFIEKLLDSKNGDAFVDFILGIFPAKYSAVLKEKMKNSVPQITQVK